jgi:hypothetical protein
LPREVKSMFQAAAVVAVAVAAEAVELQALA